MGLASHFDESVRFTNSTISALKQQLISSQDGRHFLVQPAVRLRNLNHWRRTREMSPYGCSFVALGTLAPPDQVAQAHGEVVDFLAAVGVERERILLRVSSADIDLLDGAARAHSQVEIDGYEQARYRHVFGMPGVSGRNTNIAVDTGAGSVDVANVIIIERAGLPIAVETAYGVSMIVTLRDRFDHPVLASPGSLSLDAGVDSLMAADCIGTAIALLLEGLAPVARGRGGRLRTMLSLFFRLAPRADVTLAASSVARAETAIRHYLSPPTAGLFTEQHPRDVVDSILTLRDALEAAGA